MELNNFFATLLSVFAVLTACQSYSLPYNPPSTAPCGPVCALYCPAGNVLDERGCPTCRCKPEPTVCALCFNLCPYGRETAPNGCPSCTCRASPPQPVTASPALCQRALCRNYCFSGRVLDNQGCDTCTCKPDTFPPIAPTAQRPAPSTATPLSQCGRLLCKNYCSSGRVLDSHGCDTCQCRPDVNTGPYTACPAIGCANYCLNGFELDSRGCQTCSCKSVSPINPFPVCPAIRCANYCPNGFQRDSRGCDTCTCQSSTPRWGWDDQKECNYNRCYRQCVQGKTKALPCNCDCSKFRQW